MVSFGLLFALDDVEGIMAGYRKILPRTSDYWEACARHTSRQTARTLQTGYYCDGCAQRLTREAFNDRPAVYHGAGVIGFCGLCSRRKKVYLRQWFACGICWNVILAYQKSIVASLAIQKYWRKTITPEFPHLALIGKEAVSLSPYSRKAKTKIKAAEALTELDFVVKNQRLKKRQFLFHIKLKSGLGAIDEMREFHLGIRDSNDIVGAANNSRLPVYVFHVETEYKYDLPTRASIARKIWWTDVFRLLEEHRLSVRTRIGEARRASCYSPSTLQTTETFLEELRNNRYRELQKWLSQRRLKFT